MLTTDSAASLVKYFRAQFGLPWLTTPELGLLGHAASLFVTADGRWRPEGLTITRRRLLASLHAWTTTDGRDAVPSGGVSGRDVASALARYWGASHFPSSADRAAADIGRTGQFLLDWEKRFMESDAVRTALVAGLERPPDQLPDGARPVWWGSPAAWPGNEHEERASLARGIAMRAFGDVPPTRDERLQVIREVVASRIMDLYLAHPDDSLLRRTFNGMVMRPWFWDDPGVIRFDLERTPADPMSPRTASALAAMTQMFAHDCALPLEDAEAEKKVVRRLAATTAMRQVLLATPAHEGRRTLRTAAPRSELEFVLRRDAPFEDPGTPPSASELRESTTIVDDLEHWAGLIHRPRLPYEAAELCRRYVEHRRRVEVLHPFDALRLEVSDHSVHLDLLRLKLDDLTSELGTIIRSTSATVRGLAYRPLSSRIEALLDARKGGFPRAVGRIENALSRLEANAMDPSIDPRALVESRQQLNLSAAGIAVRILEATISLTRSPEPNPQARRWAARALSHVDASIDHLGELASPGYWGSSEDGAAAYLSTPAWKILPSILRFRIRVAVLAADHAGLLSRVSFGVGDVEQVESEYVSLVSHTDLTEPDALSVIRNALVLAFIGEGSLPAAPGLSIARAGFLDVANAADVVAWEGERVTLDLDAIDSLFRNVNQDAGIMDKMVPDGPLASSMRRQPELFDRWLLMRARRRAAGSAE